MLKQPYVNGAPVWIDLGVNGDDLDKAAAFYRTVFGWEFQSLGEEAGGYGMFTLDGRIVAALGPNPAEFPPSWSIYFRTPDADATTEAVRAAGGSVLFEPMDVFTYGRMAHYLDPAGAGFAVWQPGENKGLDVVMTDNTLSWTELHTTDTSGAASFYGEVFGWAVNEVPSPGGPYGIVTPAGEGEDYAQGGIAGLAPGMRDSAWLPYFAVADADATCATITSNGGTVLMGPDDVPEVGRIAFVRDPLGAHFSIIKPVPMG
jgi:predicted enzyme related to lactoylglutathione lyase